MDNQDVEYIKLMAKAEAYEEMAMLLKIDAEHCKLKARSVASNIPMVKASQFTPDVQAEGDCMSLFENIDEYRKSLLEEKEQEIKRLEKELDGKDTSNLDLKLTPYVVKNDACGR